jgi:nitrogen-specific signal transduction histidine kinase
MQLVKIMVKMISLTKKIKIFLAYLIFDNNFLTSASNLVVQKYSSFLKDPILRLKLLNRVYTRSFNINVEHLTYRIKLFNQESGHGFKNF